MRLAVAPSAGSPIDGPSISAALKPSATCLADRRPVPAAWGDLLASRLVRRCWRAASRASLLPSEAHIFKTKTVEPLDDSGDHTELESALKSSNRNCESAPIAVALQ